MGRCKGKDCLENPINLLQMPRTLIVSYSLLQNEGGRSASTSFFCFSLPYSVYLIGKLAGFEYVTDMDGLKLFRRVNKKMQKLTHCILIVTTCDYKLCILHVRRLLYSPKRFGSIEGEKT